MQWDGRARYNSDFNDGDSKKPLTAHKGNTIEVAALNKPFYLSK